MSCEISKLGATPTAPRRGSCGRLREEADELLDRHRLAEEKPLDVFTAALPQERKLTAMLDAFGDHLHVEIVRKIDDRLRDGSTAAARRQIANERARHFHPVEPKVEEMG